MSDDRGSMLLLACAASTTDMDVITLGSGELQVTTDTATLDWIALDDCDSGDRTVEIGDSLDLRQPSPISVPTGDWCGLVVSFASGPFDGSSQLAGTATGRSTSRWTPDSRRSRTA